MIRLARAAAPALDLIVRTLLDDPIDVSPTVLESMEVVFVPSTLSVTVRVGPDNFDQVAEIVIEAFTRDAWTMSTLYDNGDATTGNKIGWRFGHPITRTRTGDEPTQSRPATLMIELPMPDRSLALDGHMITRMSNDAYNVVNDLLTQQAVVESEPRVVPLHKSPQARLADDPVEVTRVPFWALPPVSTDPAATQPLETLDDPTEDPA